MLQRRTDLAVEAHELWQKEEGTEEIHPGVRSRHRVRNGISVTEVTVSSPAAGAALGKPPGSYLTLELDPLFRREEDSFSHAVHAIAEELRPLLPPGGTALVAGLGSRTITADFVGPGTVDHLFATRHLVEQIPQHFGTLRPVAALAPGVLASTGLESASVVGAVVRQLHPAVVLAVDALASRSLERLCRTVQISDTGIVPGSGVGNHRSALTQDTLGVPVLAIGAPTVVDGATLALDLLEKAGVDPPEVPLQGGENLFVCPRDTDQRVADLCKVLGWGISLALNPSLTMEDLAMLLE